MAFLPQFCLNIIWKYIQKCLRLLPTEHQLHWQQWRQNMPKADRAVTWFFFPHLTFLFDLFNILIPWDSSCEQGGKPKVVSRCDASMFSLHPRKTNTASLGKGENVCCLWCKIESWDSKTQVLLPCCPRDFSKAQLF